MLWDYAQERLSEGPLETVERHIMCCDRCRADLSQVRRAAKLLVAYNRQEQTRPRTGWLELREQLIAEPVTYMRTVPQQERAPRRLAWAVPVVAAALVVAFGLHNPILAHQNKTSPGSVQMASPPPAGQTEVAKNIPDISIDEALWLATAPDAAPAAPVVKPVTMHVAVAPVTPRPSVKRWRPISVSLKHSGAHSSVRRSLILPESGTRGDSAPVTDVQTVSLETQAVTGSLVPASQNDEIY
jgi:hypothetical protein